MLKKLYLVVPTDKAPWIAGALFALYFSAAASVAWLLFLDLCV